VEKMSAVTTNPAYVELLVKISPKIIQSEEENERYTEALYALEKTGTHSPEEKDLADLLTLLIEDFEEKHYRLPKATPLEALAFLMDQHGLKQKDLVDVFKTASVVSAVLNGERELNKGQIQRLSERFHVSPELFF
jgi:HTH-type transcriptional regulator / antitoxin HigA